jgi:hypothetical protein
MAMIAITTSNSISVKPKAARFKNARMKGNAAGARNGRKFFLQLGSLPEY